MRYLDEPEQGQFTQVGAVVEECQFEEAPDEAQQGEVHDVAETLAEPVTGHITLLSRVMWRHVGRIDWCAV